jgi:hypothetical protein
MQRLLIVLVILGICYPAQAQQETLFGGDVSHGGFGALVFQGSVIDGQPAYIQGVRGGWIINFREDHSLSLGVGSYELENQIQITPPGASDNRQYNLTLDYSTFEVEYTYLTNRLLHVTSPLLIGGGTLSYEIEHREGNDLPGEGFFVCEPGVRAELNIVSWFRVGAGLSYRWFAGGGRFAGLDDDDLSNLSGTVVLKFGGF